jgi:hypothetical protein
MVWSENPTPIMTINYTNHLIVRCFYHFYHTSPDTNIHMFLCQHYVLFRADEKYYIDKLPVNFAFNHGYETPKQALETNSKARCGVLHPPLCGIIPLTPQISLHSFSASVIKFESHNKGLTNLFH